MMQSKSGAGLFQACFFMKLKMEVLAIRLLGPAFFTQTSDCFNRFLKLLFMYIAQLHCSKFIGRSDLHCSKQSLKEASYDGQLIGISGSSYNQLLGR
jgi:hypothetical protein